MSPVFSLVILCLVVKASFAGQGDMMSRADYPNPQRDIDSCGRGGRKSWICDPHNILTFDEANQLDTQVDRGYNTTACPCSNNVCKSNPGGYRIAVAIVQKMEISAKDKENEYQNMEEVDKSLHRAKLFSYTLKWRWDMGRCAEDVLIFYSVDDNVLYTMTGDVAKHKLTGRMLGEIAMQHRMNFGPGRETFAGFQKVIKDYISVFRGTYQGLSYNEAGPRYAAVVGRGSATNMQMSVLALTAMVVASICKTVW